MLQPITKSIRPAYAFVTSQITICHALFHLFHFISHARTSAHLYLGTFEDGVNSKKGKGSPYSITERRS